MCRSVGRLVGRSFGMSVGRSVGRPVIRYVRLSVCISVNTSVYVYDGISFRPREPNSHGRAQQLARSPPPSVVAGKKVQMTFFMIIPICCIRRVIWVIYRTTIFRTSLVVASPNPTLCVTSSKNRGDPCLSTKIGRCDVIGATKGSGAGHLNPRQDSGP